MPLCHTPFKKIIWTIISDTLSIPSEKNNKKNHYFSQSDVLDCNYESWHERLRDYPVQIDGSSQRFNICLSVMNLSHLRCEINNATVTSHIK